MPTDAEGRFVAKGLATGKAMVAVAETGVLLIAGPEIDLPHLGEYVFVMDEGLVETPGTVVDAGAVLRSPRRRS